jgi:hypothetical protein
MRLEDLTGELQKFSPADAPDIRALGDDLSKGWVPTPDRISSALFSLEQFAEMHPAHAPVYQGLIRAIYARIETRALAWNPGRFCDEVENPEAAEPESQERLAEPPAGAIPVRGQDHAKLDAGAEFDFDRCDHDEVPDPDREQDILLEDQGAIPPPGALYADTYNFQDVAPPWTDERWLAVEGQMEALSLATNPGKRKQALSAPAAALALLPDEWKRPDKLPAYLLGSNPKMAEGRDRCWLSAGLSLAPWTVAGVGNLCKFASKGCSSSCLNISGQAEASLKHATAGRIKKTKLLFTPETRAAFAAWIDHEVGYWLDLASRNSAKWPASFRKILGWREGDVCSGKYQLGLRMNVLSDISWATFPLHWPDGRKQTMMERFSDLRFYDYTKNPHRMLHFLEGRFPAKYYLTFSWSEINADFAFSVLDRGGCVAMPFDTLTNRPEFTDKKGRRHAGRHLDLPTEFCGYPVIDADTHDFRFLDCEDHADLMKQYGTGLICGLRLKGAKHRREFEENKARELEEGAPRGWHTGGFVQYAEDCGMVQGKQVGENLTNRPGYKRMLIAEAQRKRAAQEAEDFLAVPRGWKAP